MASLQEIATAAGVSTATVSVVLSNKSQQVGISKSTQAKIRNLSKEFGYKPHLMARGLRTGQTYTIGLLFNTPRELIYAELLSEIQALLRPYGYGSICAFWEDEASAVDAFLEVSTRGVDAIITSHDDLSLIPASIPTTLIFQQDDSHDSINYDVAASTNLVAQYLLNLGHRKLGIVDLNRETREPLLMSALGPLLPEVTVQWTCQPMLNYLEGAKRCLAEIFDLPVAQRPTALICRNDTVAMLAISEIRKFGLRVPQDISVIGADAVFFGMLASPPLTSIGVLPRELAAQAVELTISRLKTPDAPFQKIILNSKILERESCSPPNG